MNGKKPLPTPAPAAEEAPPEPRALFYVVSVIVPLAGIILGAIYLSKPDAASKSFGKNCLICALIPIGLYIMCVVALVIFYVAFIVFYLIVIVLILGAAGAGALKGALLLAPLLF